MRVVEPSCQASCARLAFQQALAVRQSQVLQTLVKQTGERPEPLGEADEEVHRQRALKQLETGFEAVSLGEPQYCEAGYEGP